MLRKKETYSWFLFGSFSSYAISIAIWGGVHSGQASHMLKVVNSSIFTVALIWSKVLHPHLDTPWIFIQSPHCSRIKCCVPDIFLSWRRVSQLIIRTHPNELVGAGHHTHTCTARLIYVVQYIFIILTQVLYVQARKEGMMSFCFFEKQAWVMTAHSATSTAFAFAD